MSSPRVQKQAFAAGFSAVCIVGLGSLFFGSEGEPPPTIDAAPQLKRDSDAAPPERQTAAAEAEAHGAHRAQVAAPARDADCASEESMASCTVLRLDEMTRYAHRIVLGRVVAAEARRGEGEDAHLIFTHYTLEVLEAIKGTQAKTVSVRVLGGALPDEGVSTQATHQPKPILGERAIVFIEDDPRLFTSVLGNLQGYLKLEGRGVRDGFGRPIVGVGAGERLLTGERATLSPDALVEEIQRLDS